MRRALRLVLVAVLMLGAVACRDSRPRVDTAAATEAAGSDEGFDRMVALAADEGVSAEAARILAVAAVRRAPVLAARAKAEPDTVSDFVAALTESEPDTVGPLTAAVVEGVGLAVHQALVSYSADKARGGADSLLFELDRLSKGLERLASAVRDGDDGDAVWAALLAALAAVGPPRAGSLFADIDDRAVAALAADGVSKDAPDQPRDLVRSIRPLLHKILASLLYAEPSIRAGFRAPPDVSLAEFVAGPNVAFALDVLSSADGRSSTPAAVLARLVIMCSGGEGGDGGFVSSYELENGSGCG